MQTSRLLTFLLGESEFEQKFTAAVLTLANRQGPRDALGAAAEAVKAGFTNTVALGIADLIVIASKHSSEEYPYYRRLAFLASLSYHKLFFVLIWVAMKHRKLI